MITLHKLSGFIVCTILVITTLFSASIDEISSSMPAGEDGPKIMTRSPGDGGTYIEMVPSDSSMTETIFNLSSNEGKAWELENNLLAPEEDFTASTPGGGPICGSRSIIRSGSSYFVAFTRGSDSYLSFWLTRYDEEMERWEEPIIVNNFSGELTGRPELAVLDDELFYIMPLVSSGPSNSRILAASTSIDRWYWMSNSSVKRVDDHAGIDGNIGSVVWGSALVFFWTEEGTDAIVRRAWEDGVLGNTISVMSDVGLFTVNNYRILGTNRLIMFHTDADSSGINISLSTTGGLTWSDDMVITGTMQGISSISSTKYGQRYYLNAISTTEARSSLFRSDDGMSWSVSPSDIPLTGSAPDGYFEGQISADRSQVVLALENNGSVEIHASHDGGDTFQLLERLQSGMGYPVQSLEKGLVGAFGNGRSIIYRFKESMDGQMVTGPLTPMGLKSWDDIGLDVVGYTPGTFVGLRILNREMTLQLYPGTGWLDLSELQEGDINGRHFSSMGMLSGGWTSGPDLSSSIRIELRLQRSEEQAPAVSRIYLNYTTAFPFTSQLGFPENIVSAVNCSATGNGYMLDNGKAKGEIVIGPIEKEEDWCDIISFRASSITSRVTYRMELLDRELAPIRGFEEERSVRFTGSSVKGFARWGRNFLFDLPGPVNMINVRITIESEVTNGMPVIESITFEDSEAPSLISVEVDRNDLLRGESAIFEITASDREAPMEQLHVNMEHMGPEDQEWSSEMFKGQILGEGVWEVPFVTEYSSDPGSYDIKVTLVDPMGDTFSEVMALKMKVRNNPPVKPFAYIDSDRVSSGDAVFVVIYTPGKDLETPTEELTYSIGISRDGTPYESVDGFTDTTYLIPENTVEKGEVWNISIAAFDGMDSSDPLLLSFEVENSPPKVLGAPRNITMKEDGSPHPLDIDSWFSDHDRDELHYSLIAGEGVYIIDNGSGQYLIGPEPDFNGISDLEVTASDGASEAVHHADVIVEPVNDPPVLHTMGDVVIEQGQTLVYHISAFDQADDEPVSVSVDILNKIPGVDPGTNLHMMKNGSFILKATNDMMGEFRIVVTADDGTEKISSEFNITIINTNDPPSRPMITVDPDLRMFIGKCNVVLRANATDPDIPWGDELRYIWRSDIQGELGDGKVIEVTLEEGHHVITVEVEDLEGSSVSATEEIEVAGELTSTGETLRTADLIKISLAVGALIGAIIGILIALIRHQKKRTSSENGGEDHGDEKENGDKEKKEDPVENGKEGGEKDE